MSDCTAEFDGKLNTILAELQALKNSLEQAKTDLSEYIKKTDLSSEICSKRDEIVLCLRDSEQWYETELDLGEYLLNG